MGGRHVKRRVYPNAKRVPAGAAPKERETDIVRGILQYLACCGVLAWRVAGQGSAYSKDGETKFRKSATAGFPDIAGVVQGRLVCFEVKTKKGRVSDLQKEWIEKLNGHGAYAAVVRSIEDVAEVLEELKRCAKLELPGGISCL